MSAQPCEARPFLLMPTPAAPENEPTIEVHSHNYAWAKRFPGARMLLGGEGEAVYAAEAESTYWVIRDSGTMADFLPDEDDIGRVTLERYESREAWERACKRWASRLVPHHAEGALDGALRPLASALGKLARDEKLTYINEPQLKKRVKAVLPLHIPDFLKTEMTMRATEYPARCAAWPKLGGIDIVLEEPGCLPAAIELKAGSEDDALGACAWDTVKLGFLEDRGDIAAGFLLAITKTKLWKHRIRGAELFEHDEHRAETLRGNFAKYFRKYERDKKGPYPVADRVPLPTRRCRWARSPSRLRESRGKCVSHGSS